MVWFCACIHIQKGVWLPCTSRHQSMIAKWAWLTKYVHRHCRTYFLILRRTWSNPGQTQIIFNLGLTLKTPTKHDPGDPTRFQCWLGITKFKIVFRSFLTHSKKLLQNLKIFLFNWILWLTDSLYLLMPSDKSNLIMATATDLVSSLFNVTSSGDVPFHQPQQLQYLHHFSTKAHLCSPLYSIPFSLYHVDEALKYTRYISLRCDT